MRFAPQDVAFVADPYPVYEELRASAPVTYDAATEDELVGTCVLLLNAGHEATVNATLIGWWTLFRNPDKLQRLGADHGSLPTAVEELLRFDTPLQLFERTLLERFPRMEPVEEPRWKPSYIVRGLDGLRVRLG